MNSQLYTYIKSKMKQLFKIGTITNIIPDSFSFPRVQLQTIGNKTQNVSVINVYGVHGVAPLNGIGYMWNINGDEGNIAAITDAPNLRPTGLLQGELVLGNWLSKNRIKFNADGSIDITTDANAKVNVNGCEFMANGVARIPVLQVGQMQGLNGGPVNTDEDIVSDGISLQNHTHSGVTPGSGNSGGPQ